jgi:hypothetical protein
MKALTVCQPWAWALIYGPKRIENRTWHTTYRGPLLIHAGKSVDWLCDALNDGTPVPRRDLVFGAIIGVVDLVACVRPDRHPHDPFAEGPWCWVTTHPRPIAPIYCRGAQGLWNPEPHTLARVVKGAAA